MAKNFTGILLALMAISSNVSAMKESKQIVDHKMLMNHGDGHLMDMEGGMVMGQNKETLPPGCSSVSEDVSFEVRAGHKYARDYPGTMFGFNKHEWHVKPCARLSVTFINEDNIRHQWMMHGLPKFIYDKGMFHLEVPGPGKITGTLIMPAEDRTYLIHCDISQHMEKGMKGQLIVGNGSTPFPSIPGLTDPVIPDDYGPKVVDQPVPDSSQATTPASAPAIQSTDTSSGTFLVGLLLGAVGTPFGIAWFKRRYADMGTREALHCMLSEAKSVLDKLLGLLATLIARFNKKPE